MFTEHLLSQVQFYRTCHVQSMTVNTCTIFPNRCEEPVYESCSSMKQFVCGDMRHQGRSQHTSATVPTSISIGTYNMQHDDRTLVSYGDEL